MLGGISSSSMSISSYSSINSSSNRSSISSSQSETMESILSNYDSENLTSEDAKEIVESFKEAGIEPSQEMAETMAEFGFDAREVGDLAGVGKGQGDMPPPPPPPSGEEVDSISSLLDTLFSDEEDEESTTTSESSSESSFSTEISDYSTKIANLNDSSKNELLSLLDKLSANNTDYSSDEVNAMVKNSLNHFLGDSSNFTQRSYYA